MPRTQKATPHLPRYGVARTSIGANPTEGKPRRPRMTGLVSPPLPWLFYGIAVLASAAATQHVGPVGLMIATASGSLFTACVLLAVQAVRDA